VSWSDHRKWGTGFNPQETIGLYCFWSALLRVWAVLPAVLAGLKSSTHTAEIDIHGWKLIYTCSNSKKQWFGDTCTRGRSCSPRYLSSRNGVPCSSLCHDVVISFSVGNLFDAERTRDGCQRRQDVLDYHPRISVLKHVCVATHFTWECSRTLFTSQPHTQ
jgi:hypothetical protein